MGIAFAKHAVLQIVAPLPLGLATASLYHLPHPGAVKSKPRPKEKRAKRGAFENHKCAYFQPSLGQKGRQGQNHP